MVRLPTGGNRFLLGAPSTWLLAQAVPGSSKPLLDTAEWNQAVVGLAIVGVAGIVLLLIVLAWGRHVRRIAQQGRGPSRFARDAWYAKPLASDLDEARRTGKTKRE